MQNSTRDKKNNETISMSPLTSGLINALEPKWLFQIQDSIYDSEKYYDTTIFLDIKYLDYASVLKSLLKNKGLLVKQYDYDEIVDLEVSCLRDCNLMEELKDLKEVFNARVKEIKRCVVNIASTALTTAAATPEDKAIIIGSRSPLNYSESVKTNGERLL